MTPEFFCKWKTMEHLIFASYGNDSIALKNFVNHGTCFDEDDMAQALAAIAKVEGGAA